MNLKRYQEIRAEVLNEAKSVEDKKRLSYTSGDANVLRNFVSDAEFVGTNQLQNCLTHFMKQVRGISSYVQHPNVVPSETLLSRAADIINYVVLMVANAEDSGRDTGLEKKPKDSALGSWKNLLSNGGGGKYVPIHKDGILPAGQGSNPRPFSFVALANKDEETAKVLNDFYSYTFGYDRSEEPWKD
mgnify:CR=1 FL=1